MDELDLDLFWEKVLNNIKRPSRQALFKQQAKLVDVDFDNQTIIISFPCEAFVKLASSEKNVISDAIFRIIEVDFKVLIILGDKADDDDDKSDDILLSKLERFRKNLLPNQSIICKGWISYLPNLTKSN